MCALLWHYLGICLGTLFAGVELVGVFVVANRVGGYEAGLVEDLGPMAEAVALALQGLTFRQQLAEASRLALILLKVRYTRGPPRGRPQGRPRAHSGVGGTPAAHPGALGSAAAAAAAEQWRPGLHGVGTAVRYCWQRDSIEIVLLSADMVLLCVDVNGVTVLLRAEVNRFTVLLCAVRRHSAVCCR